MKAWHCNRCGFEGETGDAVETLFHRCAAGHRGGVRPLPDREQERQDWARRVLGARLEESVRAKSGPLVEEEA